MHSAITIVRNKNNLTTMAFALHSIINCEPLRFTKIYENTCFGHVMFKIYEYATNDDTTSKSLIHVNLKDMQFALQKTITSTKKSKKGK
jgi:hypothetical protein